MIICIAENRLNHIIGLKILLLSLQDYLPNIPIYLYFPNAPPSFLHWARKIPSITYINPQELKWSPDQLAQKEWDIKAYLLLHLLELGHPEVWWLDSDILITTNFHLVYSDLSHNTLVVCEEALYGQYTDQGLRTQAWGLPIGNRPPFCYNTAVVRTTQAHKTLLHRWCSLLNSNKYLEAKKIAKRPIHLYGDQDVLTALLGSKKFEDLPLKILTRGEAIIQYFGFSAYTTPERMQHLMHGMPPFIHCQRWKPWIPFDRQTTYSGMKKHLQETYLQLSPYGLMAAKYKHLLDEPAGWMSPLTPTTRFFDFLDCNRPPLRGLPLAILFDAVRVCKSCLKKINTAIYKNGQ